MGLDFKEQAGSEAPKIVPRNGRAEHSDTGAKQPPLGRRHIVRACQGISTRGLAISGTVRGRAPRDRSLSKLDYLPTFLVGGIIIRNVDREGRPEAIREILVRRK